MNSKAFPDLVAQLPGESVVPPAASQPVAVQAVPTQDPIQHLPDLRVLREQLVEARAKKGGFGAFALSCLSRGHAAERAEQQERLRRLYDECAEGMAERFDFMRTNLLGLPAESSLQELGHAIQNLIEAYDELAAFFADGFAEGNDARRAQSDLELYANIINVLRPIPGLIVVTNTPEQTEWLIDEIRRVVGDAPVAVARGQRGLGKAMASNAEKLKHYLKWWACYVISSARVASPSEQLRAEAQKAGKQVHDLVKRSRPDLPDEVVEHVVKCQEELCLVRELLCRHDRQFGYQRGVVRIETAAFKNLAPTVATFLEKLLIPIFASAGLNREEVPVVISFGRWREIVCSHFNGMAGSIGSKKMLVLTDGVLDLGLLCPSSLEELVAHELGHIACNHGFKQPSHACELQADLFACRVLGRRVSSFLACGIADSIFSALDEWVCYKQKFLMRLLASLITSHVLPFLPDKVTGIGEELGARIKTAIYDAKRAIGSAHELYFCFALNMEMHALALFDNIVDALDSHLTAVACDAEGMDLAHYRHLYTHALAFPKRTHPLHIVRSEVIGQRWGAEAGMPAAGIGTAIQSLRASDLAIPYVYLEK